MPGKPLRRSWSTLDLGIHSFLAISPLALGLWLISLSPLVGGNVLVAAVLAGVVTLLGAVVLGALVGRFPWSGGDYAWQTRILGARLGSVLALASWWLVVAALAPIYGNVLSVQVLDPVLTTAGWDGLASWFRDRDGAFAASLIAIIIATAFVGLGMRRAAIAQRVLVVVGTAAFLVVLGLLFTSSPEEFRRAFDERSADVYGTGGIVSSQIGEIGRFDARVANVEPLDTLTLVPLMLLFALWIGWATPLAGELRGQTHSARLALIRAAVASTMVALWLFVALGVSMTWDLYNEANNLYWGTIYGTTAPTPLPIWPNPVLFATWLTDSTVVQIALLLGMGAWVVGWAATLFLSATRVLLAAATDGVLPGRVARTTGDSVPLVALGLLVVPACALAAIDAYWNAYSSWASAGVIAFALTTLASGVAAVVVFRRESRAVAVTSAIFVSVVGAVIVAWILDPVYGIRDVGPLFFLAALYALSGAVVVVARTRVRTSTLETEVSIGEG